MCVQKCGTEWWSSVAARGEPGRDNRPQYLCRPPVTRRAFQAQDLHAAQWSSASRLHVAHPSSFRAIISAAYSECYWPVIGCSHRCWLQDEASMSGSRCVVVSDQFLCKCLVDIFVIQANTRLPEVRLFPDTISRWWSTAGCCNRTRWI